MYNPQDISFHMYMYIYISIYLPICKITWVRFGKTIGPPCLVSVGY